MPFSLLRSSLRRVNPVCFAGRPSPNSLAPTSRSARRSLEQYAGPFHNRRSKIISSHCQGPDDARMVKSMPYDLNSARGKCLIRKCKTLRVAGDKFKQGLNSARKQTGDFAAKSEKQVGRVRGAFGKLGTGIKGAAGQVPILGGAMTALANPITAIAVGVGAVAVALGKMVGRIVDAEKALRPMTERSGLASDSLQLLRQGC